MATAYSQKNGVGFSPYFTRDKTGPKTTEADLKSLNIAWYYNWGYVPTFPSDVPYVPMLWGNGGFKTYPTKVTTVAPLLLGFNEPDSLTQSNIPVANALAMWPSVRSWAQRLGSPVMAGNLLRSGCWLEEFTAKGGEYDFVAVHWYGPMRSSAFINYINGVYSKYKKPIWVTEFGPSYAPGATYTQEQVNTFIVEAIAFLESSPFIERYAWYNAYVGVAALFTPEGVLTETGRMWAAATATVVPA